MNGVACDSHVFRTCFGHGHQNTCDIACVCRTCLTRLSHLFLVARISHVFATCSSKTHVRLRTCLSHVISDIYRECICSICSDFDKLDKVKTVTLIIYDDIKVIKTIKNLYFTSLDHVLTVEASGKNGFSILLVQLANADIFLNICCFRTNQTTSVKLH